jgi:hypothetical protein
MLVVCNKQSTSAWYLLCLIFYPHADLMFSMLRRRAAGKTLFGADNGHLHNLLYRKLSSIDMLSKQANTITGMLISIVFAGLPLLVNQCFQQINWLAVYAMMWFSYSFCWGFLTDWNFKEITTFKPVAKVFEN